MLDEPPAARSHVSVFITHFLNRPVENCGILRKLYLDFDLSMWNIVELTDSAWPKTSILEAIKTRGIEKEKFLTFRPRYGMCVVDGQLVPHEQEQEVIKLILKLKGDGRPQRDIANRLNSMKIKSKTGRRWQGSVISTIARRESGKNNNEQ